MAQQNQAYVVTTQPDAGVKMTTVTTTQPATIIAVPPRREWSSGICGCCEDCSSCLCSLFCPFCYLSCNISKRMNEHCCTPWLVPDVLLIYRMKLRTRYNIRGSAIHDCCCGVCCGLCVLCQLARELKYIEEQNNGSAFPKGS